MLCNMWPWLLFCVFVASVAAQQDSPQDDARALLLEARRKVMLTVNRLPKYMCTETVDRSTFLPKTKVAVHSCDDLASLRRRSDWRVRIDTSDRLRLDVAVSTDNEMYSWAGEDRFQDRSLADLVRGGATATGAFAASLTDIFGTDAAYFTYNGDVNTEGRTLVTFGFRVPYEKSTYYVGSKQHGAIVAYDGTFLVDPKTYDLVRLTVRADGFPTEFHACEATATLDYGSVQLNNSEFLLPKDDRLQIINADGSESENQTVFSGCHEFRGESSLHFGAASESEQGAAQRTASKVLALPPGLSFRLAIRHAIDTATAAAGDRIKAQLVSPIKDKSSGVLVPKGAAVTGRIVQLKRSYGPKSESLTLALRLETIEAHGMLQPFDAKLESVVRRRASYMGSLVVRQDLGSFGSFDEVFDPEDASVGILAFEDVTKDFVISRGVEMDGTTAAPK